MRVTKQYNTIQCEFELWEQENYFVIIITRVCYLSCLYNKSMSAVNVLYFYSFFFGGGGGVGVISK